MRTIFYATSVTLLIAAAVGCSNSNPVGDGGVQPQICPKTIEDATKTSGGSEGANDTCHVDGYICVVGFPCGNFVQQATCTCSTLTNKFSCVLAANGDSVPDDTTDSTGLCQSINPDSSSDTCPTDKTTADGTPCHTSGEICTYSTTCTNQPPPQDTCQCKGNQSGDAGLSWSCDLNPCP